MIENKMPPLILASTSIYRRELLERLAIPFDVAKPNIDEETEKSIKGGLTPQDLCIFLSIKKAQSLASVTNCVIGSDQMVVMQNHRFDKPGSKKKAIEQLEQMQGKTHELLTAVCVIYKNHEISFIDRTIMHMRILTKKEIHDYVDLDSPIDCAGSYKIEKHGISLFEKIQTEDFTAIPGLPLIRLGKILRDYGY